MICAYEDEPLAISQRDPNYYEFWNEQETQDKVVEAVATFWEEHIKGKWEQTGGNCASSSPHTVFHPSDTSISSFFLDTFDFLLTRDLTRGHIIDFNPYWMHTDPLLFSYEELLDILLQQASSSEADHTPILRVIDSRGHPAANRNAPTHQHNMIPIEALALSDGRSLEEFASVWQDELRKSTVDSDDEGNS